MMIDLAPAEIRLRRSAICSDGPPLRLARTILETMPDASASALIEQTISSRQPLPISVLETPITYWAALAGPFGAPTAKVAPSASAAMPQNCFIGSSRSVAGARRPKLRSDFAATCYM